MWKANVFTIFPEAFPGNLGVSLIGKALNRKWELNVVDLKKYPYSSDRVDDIPYGGGDGMILSPVTFENAFSSLTLEEKAMRKIYFSPRGRKFKQNDLHEIANSSGVTMLCGRYEGVDQRILDHYEFEEISIGDFVLLGGEVAAMVIIEGCVRLLPGVVQTYSSISNDSFQNDLLEYNQYTRPAVFNGKIVPNILQSGDHAKINEYRLSESKEITRKSNKSLWSKYVARELLSIVSK